MIELKKMKDKNEEKPNSLTLCNSLKPCKPSTCS